MTNRKPSKKYFFSVEGETEQWYLEWLQDQINACETANYKVKFDIQIEKDPIKRVKRMVVTAKTEIYHFSDYESDEDIHVKQFVETMDKMKAACKLGKQIIYRFGYSNLTFDLWIVLHKTDCNGAFTHRKQYISSINTGYGETFTDMHEYKHEKNFKRCLSKLTLDDVVTAIKRSEQIMNENANRGYKLHEYKGFSYYKENPSLLVWEAIKKILKDCGMVSESERC